MFDMHDVPVDQLTVMTSPSSCDVKMIGRILSSM